MSSTEIVDPRVDAIRCASRNRHSEVVKLLLCDSRVDPRARNNEAIVNASHSGCLETESGSEW